ncbi:putative nucleoprotein [Atrato Rhabdo-like virus 3]|uniref:Nucleoprotein n=1 Tax=Atrato Rhabdo-like virus 3 TaxID=2689335 RepID=A0A6B9KL92_9RHAB|nr:putative nucleoprotein [Atrato Rhabdo-like virus 3]
MNPSMPATLAEGTAEFLADINNKEIVAAKATAVNEGVLSLKGLETLFKDLHIPDVTKREKAIVKSFFAFYLSGDIPSENTIEATILETVLLLTANKEKIITPHEGKNEWFVPNTKEDELKKETKIQASITVTQPEDMDEAAFKRYSELMLKDAATGGDFLDYILKYINDDRRFPMIRDVAVGLALTSLRAAAKEKSAVSNAYLKNNFRQNLVHLVSWPSEAPYCPPCDVFINRTYRSFGSTAPIVRSAFTVLTWTFANQDLTTPIGQAVRAFMGAMVMTHTARTGFQLINLFSQVIALLDLPAARVHELTHFMTTQRSWSLIGKFHARGADKDIWNWSRIISDGYYRNFSAKENLSLCSIFAGCLEKAHGVGIWSSKWAKEATVTHEGYRRIGWALFAQTRISVDNMEGNEHSMALLRIAMESNPAQTKQDLNPMDDDSSDEGSEAPEDPADFD